MKPIFFMRDCFGDISFDVREDGLIHLYSEDDSAENSVDAEFNREDAKALYEALKTIFD